RLLVAFLAVGDPVVERREAPVRLERARLGCQVLLHHLLQLLLHSRLVAVLPQLVEVLAPAGGAFRRSQPGRTRRLGWARRQRLRDEQDERETAHGRQRRTTAATEGQPEAGPALRQEIGGDAPAWQSHRQGGNGCVE